MGFEFFSCKCKYELMGFVKLLNQSLFLLKFQLQLWVSIYVYFLL